MRLRCERPRRAKRGLLRALVLDELEGIEEIERRCCCSCSSGPRPSPLRIERQCRRRRRERQCHGRPDAEHRVWPDGSEEVPRGPPWKHFWLQHVINAVGGARGTPRGAWIRGTPRGAWVRHQDARLRVPPNCIRVRPQDPAMARRGNAKARLRQPQPRRVWSQLCANACNSLG